MRFLVDTNVFLDFLLRRENTQLAKRFFYLCHLQKHQIFINAMSLRDAGYSANRVLHDQKRCRQIQYDIYSICSKVISISGDAAINAIFSEVKDYEDCLIMESASESMCDAIVTSNVRDFALSKVPAYSLEKINQMLSDNYN